MKQEIYVEKEPVAKVRRWALRQEPNGDVCICLVGSEGGTVASGNVLHLKADGTFGRRRFVNDEYGLQLDEQGRIVEVLSAF